MTRQDDEEEDEDFDPEGPDPSEMDSSDDPDLDVCPHCRKLISEEADRCPHCGQYVSPQDAPLSTTSLILIALLVMALLGILAYIF